MHLDVTLARNGGSVGDVRLIHLAHASAQVAADPGRVGQRQADSRHGQIAADRAADIGVAAGQDVNTAFHVSLDGDIAGGSQDTFAHMATVIHTQGLRKSVKVVSQEPVQVERLRECVDAALHGSADHSSLGKSDQVALDGAEYFDGPGKSDQVAIDHAFDAHRVARSYQGVVHRLVRRNGDGLSITPLQPKAGQGERK